MAILYVTEYQNTMPNTVGAGQAAIAIEPPLAEQVVVIGAGSLQSSIFNVNTKFVRINTDSICSIEFGTNPTAVANTQKRLAANQTEYFGVPQGQGYRVAVTATAL